MSDDQAVSDTTRLGHAEVTTVSGGVRLDVRISGEVDLANARDVAEAIQRTEPSGFDHVCVDLGSVSYLDSAGLSMLVDLARRMRTGRSRLSCRVPIGTPARRIIALTGLEATLHVEPDEPAEPADARERPDG